MDIVFVVLHYKTYQDTIECIDSIESKIDTDSYHIIVVDNNSDNGSGEKLDEHFADIERVTVLLNSSNLGFANGLNAGIKYANNTWNVKYIVTINNDTKILNNNFLSVLDKKFEQYGFSVAGPMIITKDGKCSVNPIRNTIRSVADVEKSIKRYKKLIRLCKTHLYHIYIALKLSKKKSKEIKELYYICDQTNFKLHGACWIFSRKYFEKFDGLDTSTFLYGEEDILYLHMMMNNMKTLYTPELIIYHKEDSSTEEAIPNDLKKVQFVSENCIKSLQTYISVYRNYQKNIEVLR